MKQCSKCKKLKKLSKFHIQNDRKDGHRSWCKECINANDRKKWWINPEKSRAKHRVKLKRNQNTPRQRWHDYKKAAKVRERQWDLTFEQFMTFWQKFCYYCGDEIKTIGLDRIDNNKGYELDNLVSCCSRCNYAKRKMNQEEFIDHCKKVSRHFK